MTQNEHQPVFPVRSMNQAELKFPRISHFSWGHVDVESHPPFEDTKVFPDGVREWDWRETGTHLCPVFSLPTLGN